MSLSRRLLRYSLLFYQRCSRRYKASRLLAMVSIMLQTYGRIQKDLTRLFIDIFLCLKLILFYNFLIEEFESPSNSTIDSFSPCLLLVPPTLSQRALSPSPLVHLQQKPPRLIQFQQTKTRTVQCHRSTPPKFFKHSQTTTVQRTPSAFSTKLPPQAKKVEQMKKVLNPSLISSTILLARPWASNPRTWVTGDVCKFPLKQGLLRLILVTMEDREEGAKVPMVALYIWKFMGEEKAAKCLDKETGITVHPFRIPLPWAGILPPR